MNNQDNELSRNFTTLSNSNDQTSEEMLVTDSRHGQSPAQIVERKLVSMLQGSPVLMSHLQSRRLRCPSA